MNDRTPISHYQRVRALNETERAALRGLSEGPGMVLDERAARHLIRLGLVEQFAPQGWMAITPAGRQALSPQDREAK